jgi:hypothetical protein
VCTSIDVAVTSIDVTVDQDENYVDRRNGRPAARGSVAGELA